MYGMVRSEVQNSWGSLIASERCGFSKGGGVTCFALCEGEGSLKWDEWKLHGS